MIVYYFLDDIIIGCPIEEMTSLSLEYISGEKFLKSENLIIPTLFLHTKEAFAFQNNAEPFWIHNYAINRPLEPQSFR